VSTQAQRAYEAYVKSLAPAESLLAWGSLSNTHREAWREAVAAAIDEPPPDETLKGEKVRKLKELGTAEIARVLKTLLPATRGFMLWTMDYGQGGALAYVATVGREDAIRMAREWLQHQGALG
jgi:hypothetical protein